MEKEEKALILDFLPHGYPLEGRMTPIAQAIGLNNLTLLQLVPRRGVTLQLKDIVYIGDGKRDKIYYIYGRLPREKLTETAKIQLQDFIAKIVEEQETKFVDFFNNAQPLSTRMHQLELLPGLGKKHMWEIIEERKGKPFESFDDIKKRVKLMPDPEKIIIKRVTLELQGKEKHRIFVEV